MANFEQKTNENFTQINNCVLLEFCKVIAKSGITQLSYKYSSVITGKTVIIYDISLKDLFLLSFKLSFFYNCLIKYLSFNI